MAKFRILEVLDGKWEDGSRPKDLFKLHVEAEPEAFLEDILRGLSTENRKLQGGCAELASLISESHPELLYPHVELFVSNLRAKEPILRWEAACTVGNLARVDARAVTKGAVDTLAHLLEDKSIVLQGHAVKALAKVAVAFPEVAPRVLDTLMAAHSRFPGNRIGYVVESMGAFAFEAALAQRAQEFLTPYAESEINAVATKARKAQRLLVAAAARKTKARKTAGKGTVRARATED